MLAVINFNGKEWLPNCLSSLVNAMYPDFKIFVLDNASTDGSAKFIGDNYSQIELIRNKKNVGFGAAVNQGINIAAQRHFKYIVFLNPDIKVSPDWLDGLVRIMEEDSDTGMVMPLHYNYSGDSIDGNISKILEKNLEYRKNRETGNLKERYDVDSVIGGAMMLRTDMVEKIGYADTIYFLYGEDTDLARRVIFHGYKIVVATKSKIMHWHRILHKDKLDKRQAYFLFRNQFIYFLKDPNRPFLSNLRRYYFDKESGMREMIKSWAPINNWRYLSLTLYVQFWIFLHLPVIFIRQLKDREKNRRG